MFDMYFIRNYEYNISNLIYVHDPVRDGVDVVDDLWHKYWSTVCVLFPLAQ